MLAFIEKNVETKNGQLAINLISSVVAFGTNLIINFFLSPYIVRELGVEANGFITLANNFISYASLVAIALNSMAGRFITIKVHQADLEGANKYYASVTVANIAFASVMLIPAIATVNYLEHIINISTNLLWDVKLLFSFVFINFLLSTAFSSWHTATFVSNRLYLQSIRRMLSQLLRVIVIVWLFALFQPSVYYVGVGTLIGTIYLTLYSLYYKRRLLPELQIRKRDIEFSYLRELVSSGIWQTILKAGQLLLSGLDLIIANLFIGSNEMGMLALAKTVPFALTHLAGTLASVFAPTLTIQFAKGNLDELKNDLKKSMKFLGVILTIPLSILFVFGEEFYTLWVPTEDAQVLQVLSVLTIFGMIFTSGIQTLYNIFTVVNRLRVHALLMVLAGIVNVVIVLVLLLTTNLGIYAVAAVSTVVNFFRNILFTVPYGAKYLNLKWHTFFPEVIYSVICSILSVLIGLGVKQFFVIDSWFLLSVAAIITAIIGLALNVYVVLNKKERQYLYKAITRRLNKKQD
ncbi:oligosaccharide flippase family protein [Oceanobacillus bengalensis]|uniref:oligosaccharide flippase family protein n=1 Tax=Oceanobacillus bengalensis TaxID=1435466 RepID=UPI0016044F51|nr:oligosaccharide flippase family protein [Oceanobacillus bengalensis]